LVCGWSRRRFLWHESSVAERAEADERNGDALRDDARTHDALRQMLLIARHREQTKCQDARRSRDNLKKKQRKLSFGAITKDIETIRKVK
jgi:uncharacterized membrane protein